MAPKKIAQKKSKRKLRMIQEFLLATDMIDFHHLAIQDKAQQLFTAGMNDVEKTRTAYEFVRDEIPHSLTAMPR